MVGSRILARGGDLRGYVGFLSGLERVFVAKAVEARRVLERALPRTETDDSPTVEIRRGGGRRVSIHIHIHTPKVTHSLFETTFLS